MENTRTIQVLTGDNEPSPQSSVGSSQSAVEAITADPPRPECDATVVARLVADALKTSVSELRKQDERTMTQLTKTFQEGLAAFRAGEEERITRLEQAITTLKPDPKSIDPMTHFWTVYKKVADEHDSDMVAKYVGDLDTSLLFAGLFSAVSATFIAQILPFVQPDPSDLTNALLLRILQHNASFDEADPLAPVTNIPTKIVRAQSILFASLVVTLFVAFIAVLGKQWILYYTRASTWGNIADRGKERQVKFVGLEKWGLHLIMELLPVLLQFALFLFGIGLVVFLWDFDASAAVVVLTVTCVGCAFYAWVASVATIWKDCPFQTPLTVLLRKGLARTKAIISLARLRLRRRSRRRSIALQYPIEPPAVDAMGEAECAYLQLSNPAFWRHDPLFTPPFPECPSASAGFWLLENSTDFSAATAVAAVFPEFQWPSHHSSTAALVRLRDTYTECLQPHKVGGCRLEALESAAAYYVLYHTQLLRNTTKGLVIKAEKLPPELPPDLLSEHKEEWGCPDLFTYLLHVKDRSESVTSARFLSYIAPYWFCGNSDSERESLCKRSSPMHTLFQVLEDSQALNSATLTECVLCVGATMGFPLHPEDLVRVNKSCYFQLTVKHVVEHIHRIVLDRVYLATSAGEALDFILSLVRKTSFPPENVAWVNELLESAAKGEMGGDVFARFLRLRGLAKTEGTVASETLTPEDALFNAISSVIETCSDDKRGWEDDAVFGGLTAISDMHQLGSYLPNNGFLEKLYEAMGEGKPLRVRQAAYNVIHAAQDGWLMSAGLRNVLLDRDFPRRLYDVLLDTDCSKSTFLDMVETLSKDKHWHSYLREAMDVWLPLRDNARNQVARILASVGEMSLPGGDVLDDTSLVNFVKAEWVRVPGRGAKDLTTDLLVPFAEVTKRLKELLFEESQQMDVLVTVEQVVSSLENRNDGLGEDVRGIIDGLLRALRAHLSGS